MKLKKECKVCKKTFRARGRICCSNECYKIYLDRKKDKTMVA